MPMHRITLQGPGPNKLVLFAPLNAEGRFDSEVDEPFVAHAFDREGELWLGELQLTLGDDDKLESAVIDWLDDEYADTDVFAVFAVPVRAGRRGLIIKHLNYPGEELFFDIVRID
ncbi:MAG: hypothetical protein SFX73_34770 [Kofleriaceae bacterium]|nr:hypothetical protein [Kofleriaceae bacterium]